MKSSHFRGALTTVFVVVILAALSLISATEATWACHGMPGTTWKQYDGHWISETPKGRLDLEVDSGAITAFDMMPFICATYSADEVWSFTNIPVSASGRFSQEFTASSGESVQLTGLLKRGSSSGKVTVCVNDCCLTLKLKRVAVLDAYASAGYGALSVEVSESGAEDWHCSWTDGESGDFKEHREYFGSTTVTATAVCEEGLALDSWQMSYSPTDVPKAVVDGLIENIYSNPAKIKPWGGVWMTLQAICSEPDLDLTQGPLNPRKPMAQSLVPEKPLDQIVHHMRLQARDRALVIKRLDYSYSGDGREEGIVGGLAKGATLFRDPDCSGKRTAGVGASSVVDGKMTFGGLDDTLATGASTCYLLEYRFNNSALGIYGATLDTGGVRAVDESKERVPVSGGIIEGTVELNVDTDGDAIIDYWETYGYDHDGDGVTDVDFPSMGATARHKDIFVEVDWMADVTHNHKPKSTAVAAVVKAFEEAPVDNPDGVKGINLHVDAGNLGGGNAVAHDEDLSPVWAEFGAIKSANFAPARKRFFHYCVFAHNYNGNSSSGLSRDVPASDFIVSLGSWDGGIGTLKQQAGTFMHELGHNLGLRHGGVDNVSYKPNFLSIMNYFFQMDWLRYKRRDQKLDYSIFDLKDLSEGEMNEKKGLDHTGGDSPIKQYGTRYYNGEGTALVDNQAGVNVDWNGDGVLETEVAVDVNNDGRANVLKGRCSEWQNIVFNGGSIGTDIDQATPDREMEELTVEEYLRMKAFSIEVDAKPF